MQVSPNISVLVRLVCLQYWAFLSILLICELGDRVINSFRTIDVYSLCDWHLFPANMRRVLPTVLINIQTAVALEGYGNVRCSRDTCKRVNLCVLFLNRFSSNIFDLLQISHGGFSYFMILRQFIK